MYMKSVPLFIPIICTLEVIYQLNQRRYVVFLVVVVMIVFMQTCRSAQNSSNVDDFLNKFSCRKHPSPPREVLTHPLHAF